MPDDVVSLLDVLDSLNETLTYQTICDLTSQQKQNYCELLDYFISVNGIKESEKDAPSNIREIKGKALEKLVSYLLSVSGDIFKVKCNLRTSTNEIDQLIELTPKGKSLIAHGQINKHLQLFLGECKNYNKKIDVTYVGKFCSLLLTNNTRLGILFSYHGVTGKKWSEGSGLIKKFYLHREDVEKRYCIIDFNINDFTAIKEGSNFLQIIDDKISALQFDTDYLRYISIHPAELNN